MRVRITPSMAVGHVTAPPSKSMAHRMLIGAGLADGTSLIENIDLSEDIQATLDLLETLGSRYTIENGKVKMQGMGAHREKTPEQLCAETNSPVTVKLDCRESGSTLRFFIPLVLTFGVPCEFTGAERLFERPLGIYEEICAEQGIVFEKEKCGLRVDGRLKAGHYKVPGNISSQFITGLLFALPLLDGDSVLEMLPPVESRAYIDMTLEALRAFGIIVRQEKNTFYISGGQAYQARNVQVEGDYSNAAFLDAWNLIGGNVKVEGLLEHSLQGDRIYKEYYGRLSAEGTSPVMELSDCPDLGPILMGLAAAGRGARFTGTRRLRMKESDRGAVMAQELAKFGVQADVFENEIIVHDCELQTPTEPLDSHNDHRIAMTLALLCGITGGTIEGAQAVRKSFPNFYDVIGQLGIELQYEDSCDN